MSESPLYIGDLRVTYGELVAVNGLTLAVRPGEVYGLIGANGAGKSSAIKSVMGLVKYSGGKVTIFGHDPATDGVTTRSLIGYVPEVSLLYDALTPREYLEYVASIRRLDSEAVTARLNDFSSALQIEREMDQAIATLSNGTRQKVMLVGALLHQPPLLLLDEPFNSLDPRSVRIMKDLLATYVKRGERSILFSTHTMEVAEMLCNRVGILDHGHLKGEGTMEELRRQVGREKATLEDIFLELTADRDEISRIADRLGNPTR
jgi:ABC-2 type transport system ATP-binding protein